jgi:hypothetical protein
MDHKTNETRAINVWPDDPMGHGAKKILNIVFSIDFPIVFSKIIKKRNYMPLSFTYLKMKDNLGQLLVLI